MKNKKNLGRLFTAVLIAGMLCIISLQSFVKPVKAATEQEIEDSIALGLEWLATQQQIDGSWLYYESDPEPCTDVAVTSLVLLKLIDRAKELGLDPFETDEGQDDYYEYANNVIAGYDYIFSQTLLDLLDRVYFDGCLDIYKTGAAMMAIATSNAPDKVVVTTGGTSAVEGWTYEEVLQGMMDYMTDAQNDDTDTYTCDVGGWGYDANDDGWSDESNSGYATLGIGFAAAEPPYGFSLGIPQEVLDKLSIYIDNIQDPVDGDSYDGGAWYEPCYMYKWVNILKTGNLLYQMALVGDGIGDTRVQNAIDYIENHWDSAGPQPEYTETSLGWMDSYQAMFAMMKGLVAFGINELDIGMGSFDWFDEVSDVIVANQNPAGYFDLINPSYIYEGEDSTVLRTAWALLTLEKFVPIIERYTIEKDFRHTNVDWAFYKDFEYNNGGFTPTGSWQWGIPTSGPISAHSGTKLWGTNLAGDYPNSDNAILDSAPFYVPDGAILEFWMWYDCESYYDGMNVKISTNGGATWTILGEYMDPYNEDSAYNGNPGISDEPCFSGHDQDYWQLVTFDLSAYVESTAMIRFHFGSDSSVMYPGFYIDDVKLKKHPNLGDPLGEIGIVIRGGKVKSTNPGQLYGVTTITGPVEEFYFLDEFDNEFDINPDKLFGGVEVIMINPDGYATVLTNDVVEDCIVDNDGNFVLLHINLDQPLESGYSLMIYVKFQTVYKHQTYDGDDIFHNNVYVIDMDDNLLLEYYAELPIFLKAK